MVLTRLVRAMEVSTMQIPVRRIDIDDGHEWWVGEHHFTSGDFLLSYANWTSYTGKTAVDLVFDTEDDRRDFLSDVGIA